MVKYTWDEAKSKTNLAVLVVVHTHKTEGFDEVIRIISCRRALKHERKLYEESH